MQLINHILGTHSCDRFVNFDLGGRHRPTPICGKNMGGLKAVHPFESVNDLLNSFFPYPELSFKVSFAIKLECCHQPHDLFLAHLKTPTQRVVWWAGEDALIHEAAIGPGFWKNIHILLLQIGRKDQISLSTKKTAGLGALNMFAAAEGDQIGPLGYEFSQVLLRRQLRSSINNDRNGVPMCDLCDRRQGQSFLS